MAAGDIPSVSEDILSNILSRLDEDPNDLARMVCVCRRFSILVRSICWKNYCVKVIPAIVDDLLQTTRTCRNKLSEPAGGWGSLYKLVHCCPGLRSAGVLLDNWDFGLEREIGCTENYMVEEGSNSKNLKSSRDICMFEDVSVINNSGQDCVALGSCTIIKEGQVQNLNKRKEGAESNARYLLSQRQRINDKPSSYREIRKCDSSPLSMVSKTPPAGPHLAKSKAFSREQGSKLLAGRFRADNLYISSWPGCTHRDERKNYELFRGIFKNFKGSQVWRNLRDLKAKKVDIRCAYCCSVSTWDMVTTFCLRRSLEYHDDGEPYIRAYVCENGHVAGALALPT